MDLQEVHVVRLHSLETLVDGSKDGRPTETSLVDIVLTLLDLGWEPDMQNIWLLSNSTIALGEQDELVTRYVVLFDTATDHLLRHAVAVDVCSVPCVQTTIVSPFEQLVDFTLIIDNPWLPVLVT